MCLSLFLSPPPLSLSLFIVLVQSFSFVHLSCHCFSDWALLSSNQLIQVSVCFMLSVSFLWTSRSIFRLLRHFCIYMRQVYSILCLFLFYTRFAFVGLGCHATSITYELRPWFHNAFFCAVAVGKPLFEAEVFARKGAAEVHRPALWTKRFFSITSDFQQKHPSSVQMMERLVTLWLVMIERGLDLTLRRNKSTLHWVHLLKLLF